MNTFLVKTTFLITTTLLTFNASAEANTCITHDDLVEIGETYSQIRQHVGNKTQYCEKDLGKEWFSIINSLVTLKNIQPNEPEADQADAFTYKAITENNWWAYFTKRAKKFTIERNCEENVVAYVIPMWGDGNIHLCAPFFEETVSSQASTMMHEVRHFDGHGHTTCTRGNENGIRGACDEQITRKGSYAISVQTLVGLARSPQIEAEEKPLLEAEALYMAFNKFNTVPRLKLKNSIFLSNHQGEVYKWTPGEEAKLVNTLDQPAVIHNSFNNLTIYPLDASVDAYRMDQTLTTKVESPGLFAVHYNSHSQSDRAKFDSVSYFGTGGLLKNNELTTLCNNKDLSQDDLNRHGDFVRIVSLSSNELDIERSALLMEADGSLVSFECASQDSKRVDFEQTGIKLVDDAKNIVDSFGLGGQQYAVLADGTLTNLSLSNSTFTVQALEMPIDNQGWISATPMSKPEVF
ncbi:MAG: hypothetical protein ACRBBP_04370 [Bdellovibrionales bacterium]